MRETLIIVVVLPLIILIGMIVYVFYISFTPQTVHIPAVAIRFDLSAYEYRLTYEDFRNLPLFVMLECNGCELSQSAPLTFADVKLNDSSWATFTFESPILTIDFFGDDDSFVKLKARELVQTLRTSPKFRAGFEILDGPSRAPITPPEEEAFFGYADQRNFASAHDRVGVLNQRFHDLLPATRASRARAPGRFCVNRSSMAAAALARSRIRRARAPAARTACAFDMTTTRTATLPKCATTRVAPATR
jgi:hypothetical protein